MQCATKSQICFESKHMNIHLPVLCIHMMHWVTPGCTIIYSRIYVYTYTVPRRRLVWWAAPKHLHINANTSETNALMMCAHVYINLTSRLRIACVRLAARLHWRWRRREVHSVPSLHGGGWTQQSGWTSGTFFLAHEYTIHTMFYVYEYLPIMWNICTNRQSLFCSVVQSYDAFLLNRQHWAMHYMALVRWGLRLYGGFSVCVVGI